MSALLGTGAVILTLAGCSSKTAEQASTAGDAMANTASSAAGDTANAASSAGSAVANTASAAGSAVANTAAGAANVAANAGSAVANAAVGAGKAVTGAATAAAMTPKVKGALATLNSGPLKGSNINVDTLPDKTTIALRGSVKTAQQKNLAETVAKKNAPGFKIANQLTVAK